MLARCALECVIAVDFMTIGFIYMFNQRAIRYAPVLYSNTQGKLPDLFLEPDGFSYTGNGPGLTTSHASVRTVRNAVSSCFIRNLFCPCAATIIYQNAILTFNSISKLC
jgi:hypothetical protein